MSELNNLKKPAFGQPLISSSDTAFLARHAGELFYEASSKNLFRKANNDKREGFKAVPSLHKMQISLWMSTLK